MDAFGLIVLGAVIGGIGYWRYIWFFRNPPRIPPLEEGILSPADGTVVYVKKVAPGEEVVVIKQGVRAEVKDILWEDAPQPKVVIGIFMSPFDVHYNRSPISGRVASVRHYPPKRKNHHMGSMHWRTLLNKAPYYAHSLHIVQNERKVTNIQGAYRDQPLNCYVVQIGAKTVNGIDSFVPVGGYMRRGETFGMIRVGSQVDLILPWRPEMSLGAKPGDKVRAGETVLVR
jgi:phosphatidylserine decarboxylase